MRAKQLPRICLLPVLCLIYGGCGPSPREPAVAEVETVESELTKPGEPDTGPELEGVYCSPFEFAGYTGTVLELNGGQFRYWYYSDVSVDNGPSFPLVGYYTVHGGKLILHYAVAFQSEWQMERYHDIPMLMDPVMHQHWNEDKTFTKGTMLLKTVGSVNAKGHIARPSIKFLFDEHNEKFGKQNTSRPE